MFKRTPYWLSRKAIAEANAWLRMRWQEREVQEALYGPHTRSGQVWLIPLHPRDRHLAHRDPRGVQAWVELWMAWDAIVWFPVGRSISAGTL